MGPVGSFGRPEIVSVLKCLLQRLCHPARGIGRGFEMKKNSLCEVIGNTNQKPDAFPFLETASNSYFLRLCAERVDRELVVHRGPILSHT